MKAIINTAKLNRYTTVCTVIGYYDENTEYKERTFEDLPIKELSKRVSKNIYLDHDVTVQIAPKKEIRVFAKSMEEMILKSLSKRRANFERVLNLCTKTIKTKNI